MCAVLVVVALCGYRVWGVEAQTIDPINSLQGPSRAHLLGTDQLGRDIFARTLAAAGLSAKLALLATGLAAGVGIPIGAMAGVLRNRARRLVERSIKLSLTFPGILVALALVTIIGPGQKGVVIGIGVAFAPHFARTSQTLASSIAESEFMAAARVVGIGRLRLLRRYVLANTADALVLQTATALGGALVAVATFSFLGLGMQPPQFDWGRMLGEGLPSIYIAPAAALAPGGAILIAALSVSLLGEAVASSLDPAVRIAAGVSRPRLRDGKGRSVAPRSVPSAAPPAERDTVVSVVNLQVRYPRGRTTLAAVAGVDLDIAPAEILGVVGESGSGKSTLALAIAGLVPRPGEVEADRLEFLGVDLLRAPRRARTSLLGRKLAVIFQDPMTSLNPALRVGEQIAEKARAHLGVGRREADALAIRGLSETHIAGAASRHRDYPHQFSGGMRQRAMIAMGLVTSPALIVADEPTTALDVTVQAQILGLLREVNREKRTAILFISHDIAVVTELCSRVVVMYAGRIVETIAVADLRHGAAHPYTRALMSTVVDLGHDPEQPLATIKGRPASLDALEAGCPFAPRCPLVVDRCLREEPPLLPAARGTAACWVTAGGAPGASPSREVSV
jgi:oligopeptide/dipeptide ABC transporter ATP-binding protein